jgi:hypothetical protein
MSSGLYKAVCYRCSHVAAVSATRCPACQFPMILEPESTPPGGRKLEEIFARGSVRDGAPPLPGVHAEKRKAQLLAEARRERTAIQRHARQPGVDELQHPLPTLESVRVPRFRHSALKLALFCASAVAAGVVAAALQNGAL